VRFLAFECKRNCIKDGWFKFDSILVALMVAETWVVPFAFTASPLPSGPIRLLRLLRLSRLVRIMRSIPELITIIKGMAVAFRAVMSSLFLVGMLIYIFGIVLHSFLKSSNDEAVQYHFRSLPKCMWTLLITGTFLDDLAGVLNIILDMGEFGSSLAVIFFIIFILLSALTVMNMLIGILCEVVSAVAAHEKDESDIKVMKQSVLVELKKVDDGDGMISGDELTDLMGDYASISVLEAVGIDVAWLRKIQAMSFKNPDEAQGIELLMDQMLLWRRGLPCTVEHMIETNRLTQHVIANQIDKAINRLSQSSPWAKP